MVETEFNIKSLEKGVQVISAGDQNLERFYKPVKLYSDLHRRSQNNPIFRQKCLRYKIEAEAKKKSKSDEFEKTNVKPGDTKIIFNYMDSSGEILKAQVVENFSCPFCLMSCGDHQGMRDHLLNSHDAFEYVFLLDEDNNQPEIHVSVNHNVFKSGELWNSEENHKMISFSYCSKRFKLKHRGDGNKKERLKVNSLELVTHRITENELSNGKDGKIPSPAKPGSPEKASDIVTTTQPAIAQSFEPEVQPLGARRRSAKRRKLSEERAEATRVRRLQSRQFYHSHTYQAMSLAEVLSDADSEGDEPSDDCADLQESLRLNRLADVRKEKKQLMSLWNNFVRKQRVIADGHVPWAYEAFTKLHEEKLNGSLKLFWQWRMFMIHMHGLGLICGNTINKCSTILNNSKFAPPTSQGPAS